MLHPRQLEEVASRYGSEIAELHHFLAMSGLSTGTPQVLSEVAARLRSDRAFRRDLTSHVWVAIHSSDRQIRVSDLLGMLAIAAAGPHLASNAEDNDAHDMLRFLMEARRSFNMEPQTKQALPAGRATELEPYTEPGETVVRARWVAAAVWVLAVFLTALWLHHRSAADHASRAASPAAAATEETATSAARSSLRTSSAPTLAISPDLAASTTTVRQKPSPATPVTTELPAKPTSPPQRHVHARTPGRPPAFAATPTLDATAAATSVRKTQPAYTHDPARYLSKRAAKADPAAAADTGSASTTTAGGAIVRPTSLGTMAANVIYSPAPAYPPAASALHVQGEVKLEAEVDRRGNVVSTRIISGPPLLQEAAADAVQHWRYRPFLHDGRPIGMNAPVVIDFELP